MFNTPVQGVLFSPVDGEAAQSAQSQQQQKIDQSPLPQIFLDEKFLTVRKIPADFNSIVGVRFNQPLVQRSKIFENCSRFHFSIAS